MSQQTIDPPSPSKHPAHHSAAIKTPKRFHQKWPAKILIWFTSVALATFLLLGFLVPRFATWEARKMTGRAFRFGFLVITPNGRVGISARGGQQLNQNFHLNAARVRFDWWDVILHRIRVGYVELQDAHFDIEKTDDGDLIVNGVNTSHLAPAGAATQPPASPSTEKPGKPWGLGLGRTTFSNLSFDYKSKELNANLIINKIDIGTVESWWPDRSTPFDADITLNGARILLKGTLMPFSAAPKAEIDLDLEKFPLDSIATLLASSGVRDLTGLLTVKGHLQSALEKKTGIADATWMGGINLEKISALYTKPAKTKDGIDQKFRLLVNGQIQTDGVHVHVTDVQTHPVVTYAADEIKTADDFSTELHDESFRRPPIVRISPLSFDAKNISTIEPAKPLSFDVKASLGKYDRLTTSGELTPFAKLMNGKIALNIKELNLTPFTAYSERYSGSRIDTGVLNLKTTAVIDNDQLQAKNAVLLKKLAFQYINKEKEEEKTGKVGIPSNVLLSLLQDKNGDIKLDVPVDGPIRDPNVGMGSLIAKLTAKAASVAAEKAAKAFFPPLGTIELIGSVVSFATKWRFEPLLYKSGTLEMASASETYLADIGKKLKDRPNVRLNVCGFGSRADLTGAEPPKEKSKEKLPPLTDQQKDKLIKLATDRSAAVKDTFVNQFGIEPERLLICSPASDEDETAHPRVTLSL